MIFKRVWIACLCLVVISCKRNDHEIKISTPEHVVRVRDNAADFLMPAKLWDQLLPKDPTDQAKDKTQDDEDSSGLTVIFATIDVILEEKNAGVLTAPKIRFQFQKGGGQIDLARWTTGKAGSFHVKFETEGLGDPTFRAYFLSRAKRRKVENLFVGSGCKTYSNITQYLSLHNPFSGFLVNSTKNFSTTTLGGHFIFSWRKEGVYSVTQAKFTDTANPQLFCNSAESVQ